MLNESLIHFSKIRLEYSYTQLKLMDNIIIFK